MIIRTLQHISAWLPVIAFLPVFSTVFVVNRDIADGVVAGKYFWFYGAMGVCAALVSLHFFALRKNILRFGTGDVLVLLFAATGLLPCLLRHQPVNTEFIMPVLLVALYFYFRMALTADKRQQKIMLTVLILTALVESVWGMLQLYGRLPSEHALFLLTGSFFNPGPYGGYVAVILPVALSCLARENGKTVRITAALTVAAAALVLPASMSRAAWVAAVAGGAVVGVAAVCRQPKVKTFLQHNKTKTAVVLFVLAGLAVSVGAGMYRLKENSADGRLLIWKNTVAVIKQHPAGVGFGYFSGSYGKAQAAYFASGKASDHEKFIAGNPQYAFNEYLQTGAEQGIAGLLLLLALLLRATVKSVRQKKYAVAGGIISLSVFAFFSYPFRLLPFMIIFAFFIAESENSEKELKKQRSGKWQSAVVVLLLAIAVAACIYNRFPTYKAYRDWKDLKIMYSMNLYGELRDDYKNLEPYLSDRVDFLFEYGQILSKTGSYRQSNELLQRGTEKSCDPMFYNIAGKNFQQMKDYSRAEENFLMAANIAPGRLYPWHLLAKLYRESGDTAKARNAAETLLKMEVKTTSAATEEMRKEAEAMNREQ